MSLPPVLFPGDILGSGIISFCFFFLPSQRDLKTMCQPLVPLISDYRGAGDEPAGYEGAREPDTHTNFGGRVGKLQPRDL